MTRSRLRLTSLLCAICVVVAAAACSPDREEVVQDDSADDRPQEAQEAVLDAFDDYRATRLGAPLESPRWPESLRRMESDEGALMFDPDRDPGPGAAPAGS